MEPASDKLSHRLVGTRIETVTGGIHTRPLSCIPNW